MTEPLETKEKSALVVFLLGVIGLLYQGGEMLREHTTWADFYTPPGVGEIFTTFAIGIGTGVSALYLDLEKLLDLVRRK